MVAGGGAFLEGGCPSSLVKSRARVAGAVGVPERARKYCSTRYGCNYPVPQKEKGERERVGSLLKRHRTGTALGLGRRRPEKGGGSGTAKRVRVWGKSK